MAVITRGVDPFVHRLESICAPERVLAQPDVRRTYESDGLLQYHAVPRVAVLPDTGDEVRAVVTACYEAGVPWGARGSGRGLSGGALPVEDGVLIVLTRLRRILEVDLDNQRVTVEPGVTNLEISRAVAPTHFFPPDPSSQIVCSIGGNVAENSGGAHCFKYGFTTNYVTGLEVVLPDGEIVMFGGKELDRPEAECRARLDDVVAICEARSATGIRIAADEAERQLIWKARKAAFAAMGRISPNYYVQDGVIPRTRLSEVLGRIDRLSERFGLPVANVFHAGDGNLHPLVCYDAANPGEAQRAEELAALIIDACLGVGGSITGEHGVGVDKKASMTKMFSEADLDAFQRLRCAFDPAQLANPGKVMPAPRLCGEVPGPYRQHPIEAAGVASRL